VKPSTRLLVMGCVFILTAGMIVFKGESATQSGMFFVWWLVGCGVAAGIASEICQAIEDQKK
jgi:hypothetical protein